MMTAPIAALAVLWCVPARCVPGLLRLRAMLLRSATR
jgi:hypothetical protein